MRIRNSIFLLLLVFAVGCASAHTSVRQPRLNEEQIAIISMPLAGAQIKKIDGQPITFDRYSFRVLPGMHSVTIYYAISHLDHPLYEGEDTLEFLAEAGHEYAVNASFDNQGAMTSWIHDARLKKSK